MLDTNVRGLLNVSACVLPGMVQRGSGHVINIGSNAGREVYPGGAVYCATKAAVERITRRVRLDVVGRGGEVRQVHPGLGQTGFSTDRFLAERTAADPVAAGVTPLG